MIKKIMLFVSCVLCMLSLAAAQEQEFVNPAEVLNFEQNEPSENTGSSFMGSMVQSSTIIIREGIEAILIIGAIVAYLKITKNDKKIKTIYQGAGIAILASLITAWLFDQVLQVTDASQELLEGVTMLLAAVVLFYVGYWILSKVEAEKWKRFIKGKVHSAISTGSPVILASVAFLAVYREGFETVLFYKALILTSTSQSFPILFGLAIGLVILGLLFWAMEKYGIKLPLRQFFIITSSIIYGMSFVFLGKGIHEMQEAGIFSETQLAWAPELRNLGMYPTAETFIGQVVLVVAFGFLLIYLFKSHVKASPQAP